MSSKWKKLVNLTIRISAFTWMWPTLWPKLIPWHLVLWRCFEFADVQLHVVEYNTNINASSLLSWNRLSLFCTGFDDNAFDGLQACSLQLAWRAMRWRLPIRATESWRFVAAVHGGMIHIYIILYHYIISIVGAKKFLDIMASWHHSWWVTHFQAAN